MMTGPANVRRRYESLFFVGVAVVVVLLPFPNLFGILLDATILAIANPIIGDNLTILLVFVYNFNPIKLNGVLGIYYVAYGVVFALASRFFAFYNQTVVSAVAIGFLVLMTLLEYLLIRGASVALWDRLAPRHPRFAAFKRQRQQRIRGAKAPPKSTGS